MSETCAPIVSRGCFSSTAAQMSWAGLRHTLYHERNQWDLCFATSAEAALESLAKGDFDVVVSDMSMPGMDGAPLLGYVREANPGTVRIILSCPTDRTSAVKAASVAHRLLNKPTDVLTLKDSVCQARELEGRLGQPGLRSALGCVDGLPSLSATVRSLNSALGDPRSDVDTIVRIVATGLGSSKTLQW